MLRDIKDFLDKRKLIMTLAQSDSRKKFVGSCFGLFWMFVQPIVTVAIYYFIPPCYKNNTSNGQAICLVVTNVLLYVL